MNTDNVTTSDIPGEESHTLTDATENSITRENIDMEIVSNIYLDPPQDAAAASCSLSPSNNSGNEHNDNTLDADSVPCVTGLFMETEDGPVRIEQTLSRPSSAKEKAENKVARNLGQS